jgi:hypothetical protein
MIADRWAAYVAVEMVFVFECGRAVTRTQLPDEMSSARDSRSARPLEDYHNFDLLLMCVYSGAMLANRLRSCGQNETPIIAGKQRKFACR